MNEAKAYRLVLPGEYLGTAEEFIPGFGTYEDSGRIYSAVFGHSRVDPQERAIRVDALNAIPRLESGDLVYARVDDVKSAMVIATVLSSAKSRRGIPGTPEGTIHVSKAKEGYTETLSDEFQPGDIVVAQVLQSRPSIKLSTASPNLGVAAARCQNCHGPLVPGHGQQNLSCPRCGNREHRKLARGFGVPLGPSGASDGEH
jgi:exosome complex component CSL4